MRATLEARILAGFDDPALSDRAWSEALGRTPTHTVFLTAEYQRAWWRVFGRGRLLLIGVEEGGRPAAFAPLFADTGMVFFVGSGGSDYLDFVGDPSPAGIEAILETARDAAPDFLGFLFYHVPDRSPTAERLRQAAEAMGMTLVDEGEQTAPALDLGDAGARSAALGKKSVRRHASWFQRNGGIETVHLTRAGEILPLLEGFFDQHVARWSQTAWPSLFEDPAQRAFYRALVHEVDGAGWLRFTVVRWDGRPIAFHFGFHHAGRWLWYKPSFDTELARRSPGEVLLGALLERAVEEGVAVFDFGIGDEPFKQRFASGAETVRTWGLYP